MRLEGKRPIRQLEHPRQCPDADAHRYFFCMRKRPAPAACEHWRERDPHDVHSRPVLWIPPHSLSNYRIIHIRKAVVDNLRPAQMPHHSFYFIITYSYSFYELTNAYCGVVRLRFKVDATRAPL
jgi:hypothetical protein